jgi:hypothetical protein
MIFLKIFIGPIAIISMVFITYAFCNGDKLMDKYIREQNNFSIALEALKTGKTIHRAGSCVKYLRREIIINGESYFQYGWRIDNREFHEDSSILMKDMIENDWIIEEK